MSAFAPLSTSASSSSPLSIPIHYYPSPTSSTQDLARSLLASHTAPPSLVPSPFAVMSSSQTSGLGTNSRVWLSPPGNLYLTAAVPATLLGVPEGRSVFDASNPFPVTLLPMQVGLIVYRAIASLQSELASASSPPSPPLPLPLKWPNDVLYGGGKVAGVLIQSEVSPSTTTFLIGVGVNVTEAPSVPSSGPEVGRRSASLLPSSGAAGSGGAADVDAAGSEGAKTAPNDNVVRRLGELVVGELAKWLGDIGEGRRLEPGSVTEAFARHVDFEKELVMRPERLGRKEEDGNVNVMPIRILHDGTMEVRVVETGEIKILCSEYTL